MQRQRKSFLEKWTSLILILLLFFLFLSKVKLETHMNSENPISYSKEVIRYLVESYSKEAILGGLIAGLGFKEVLSDFFFLQSIQYFGSWGKTNEERYKKSYPMLRAMGALSPHFVAGYSFGALVMEDTGYVNEAISFLDEGISNNPYAFELRLYRDFMLRLFKTHEYEKAIEGIKQAIALKSHPPILERVLAFAYEKNGQLRKSIIQWKSVFLVQGENNPGIREICRKNIKRILDKLVEKEGKEKASCWFKKKVYFEGLNNEVN